jgi:hypothetical protein
MTMNIASERTRTPPKTMKPSIILFRLALVSSLGLSASHATTIIHVDDPFTDGGATNGADAKDITWYLNNTASATTTVANDTVINTGNALRLNATSSFRRFIGVFGATITILQGETLQLSFDYRFHEAAAAGNNFRFGLFNNAGTVASGNGAPVDSDNFGYASVTDPVTDSTTGTRVAYETAGDSVLGGSTPGAMVFIGSNGTSVNSGTTSKGSALFTITRNLDDSIFLSSSINGQPAAFATLANPPSGSEFLNYSFHEVSIGVASTAADFSIDNVLVQVVPEPSAALLGGLGALMLFRRRR